MNTREIERLIDKYLEGDTTLAEEKALKDFFSTDDVPPELAQYAEQFRYLAESASEEPADPEFDRKLIEKLNGSPVILLYPKRKKLYYTLSVAAGILLLAGLFFTFRHDIFQDKLNHNLSYTTDPEVAYTQARKALMLVSVNLNAGLDQARKIGAFQTGVTSMQKISQFNKFQTIIINPEKPKAYPVKH